ncbi:MAG: 4-(cytidine 5'-diphospho)-2-C-methyl-D-erythritol kinase [Caulobacteraceae bacterium]
MIRTAFAPAKVNLYLHVGKLQPDGFHPLSSWMAFADIGDRVTVEPATAASFAVAGAFAADLADTDPAGNLVTRAARAIGAPAVRLTLSKDLPVAAGLGGGSSDAGAALRLLRGNLDDTALERAAAGLGSDGAPCLWGRPVIAEGRGEQLALAPRCPPLHTVLVNPRVACPTGAVYRALDQDIAAGKGTWGDDRPVLPASFDSALEAIEVLEGCRNDLEGPAARLVPAVAETLVLLRQQPEARLTRLSGSGATAFALCEDAAAAERLRERLAGLRPGWWARSCRLGGPWPD